MTQAARASLHPSMSEQPPKRPTLTERAQAEKQARAERAAAALRENLRKRKEQVRGREKESKKEPLF